MGNLFSMATNLFGGNRATGDEDTDDTPSTGSQNGNTGIAFVDQLIGIGHSLYDTIVKPLLDMFNHLIRGWVHPNGYHAETGMAARIDAFGNFEQVISQLGLAATMPNGMATAEYLRKTCKNAIENLINGNELPTNPDVIVRKVLHLQDELAGTIGTQLRNQFTAQFRAQNPNATPQDLAAALGQHNFALAADQAAASITGIDLDILTTQGLSDADKITALGQCRGGILGMMLATQRRIAGNPNATLQEADVPAIVGDATLIATARQSMNSPATPPAPQTPPPGTTPPAPQTPITNPQPADPGTSLTPPPPPAATRPPAVDPRAFHP